MDDSSDAKPADTHTRKRLGRSVRLRRAAKMLKPINIRCPPQGAFLLTCIRIPSRCIFPRPFV